MPKKNINEQIAECPVCGKEFECGEYCLAYQKLRNHMSHESAHRQVARSIDWDELHRQHIKIDEQIARCPICGKQFKFEGTLPADQQLYYHMRHGIAHCEKAENIDWDTGHWRNININEQIAVCPTCGKRFEHGWYHRADLKLREHMKHGISHCRDARNIEWNM